MYADPTGHKGEWWNPGTWVDNFVTGINSITGSNLKSDLEVIKQQNEEGSFNRIIGETVGRIAYYYKEGYDVIVSGTKEDRRQAFDIIDKNGTTSQSVIAHTSEYIVNGVIAPVLKISEIPSNVIKTGLKFGWSSDNPLEIVPNTIAGVGAGLIGGLLNVPHKDYQFDYNKEWLTKSVSEAWIYAYPESEEYFNTHPLARSVVDSTELVFYAAAMKMMQLNQPYDITREADLNIRALSNSKYNTKTTNIDSNKITSEGTSNTQLTFDEALKKLDKSGLRPGQTEISKSRVMEIVENYDPMKAQSSVYTDSTGRYLVEGHHTTVANTMIGKGSGVNMNIPTQQMPSATNVYWTKKWYEFWKTQIKVTK
jgi:hypothetical protein